MFVVEMYFIPKCPIKTQRQKLQVHILVRYLISRHKHYVAELMEHIWLGESRERQLTTEKHCRPNDMKCFQETLTL